MPFSLTNPSLNRPGTSASPFDWAGNFLGNMVEGMGELIGIQPSETTLRWRQDNPTAAFISNLAGYAIPYAGWFKAAKAVAPFERAISRIGNLERNPILTGAAQSAARFVPFEAGRVAISQVAGDEPLGNMIGDAVLSLALEAGVGGLIHGIAAAGSRSVPLDRLVPGLDLAAPSQLQTRFIQAAVDNGTLSGENASRALFRLRELRDIARTETLPAGVRYINALQGLPKGVAENINRLFNFKPSTSALNVRRLAQTRDPNGGFRTVQEWQDFAKEAGLPANFEDFVQYPRVVTFRGANAEPTAVRVGNQVTRNMESVGNGYYIAREADDGLFVIAKNVRQPGLPPVPPNHVRMYHGGADPASGGGRWVADKMDYAAAYARQNSPNAPDSVYYIDIPEDHIKLQKVFDDTGADTKSGYSSFELSAAEARNLRPVAKGEGNFGPDNKWLLFKTDNPAFFMPGQQRFANVMTAHGAWNRGVRPAIDGGPVYNSGKNFLEQMPVNNYRAMASHPGGFAAALEKLMPKAAKGQSSELVGRVKDAIRHFMTPARLQFVKSPRANWIHGHARALFDMAQTEAQRLLYGSVRLDPGKNLFLGAMKGAQIHQTETAIKTLVDGLTEDQVLRELWPLWRKGLDAEGIAKEVAAGRTSVDVGNAATALLKVNEEIWGNVNRTQKAVGETVTKGRAGHMGVSHGWEGDQRIILRGDGGEIIAMASGVNRRMAQKEAERIQKALGEEGTHANIAETFDITDSTKIPKEVGTRVLLPGFVLERGDLRGFRWDFQAFSKKELMDALTAGVYGRHTYMAAMSVDDLLAADLARLHAEDPLMHKMVTERINDLKGFQTAWSQMQNRVTDTILAPMLGKNSATAIVRASNNLMWHMQFAYKPAYAVMNAMAFLQTVAPEIAYVTSNILPASKAGRYTHFAAGGADGTPGTIISALSPVKFLSRSFREMAKPDAQLRETMQMAANWKVLDPRLVEEYFGENATKVLDLKSAFSSAGGFGRWIGATSEWMAVQSERFARAQSFVTGHILARDYLGLTDSKQIFRFAKQFTEHTQYLYTTADRPRMFTTPAGSAFGLFKNWMLNYFASMLEYSGQAVKGNWAPLLWQTAGTVGVGGLAATPLYMVANGFSNAFTGKSMLESSYEMFGEEGGDAINFGLPAALFNVSMYSQTATPLANPVRDAHMLFSIAHYDRIQALGRAIGDGLDVYKATGENPARNPQIRNELIRALAPTTLYRLMGAIQEEGIVSLGTGHPIVMEADPWQKLMYTLGFTPIEMERGQAVASQLFAERDARRAETQRLGQAYADATNGQDRRLILRQAVVSGVDPSSVLRSSRARLASEDQDLLERNFRPQDVSRFSFLNR